MAAFSTSIMRDKGYTQYATGTFCAITSSQTAMSHVVGEVCSCPEFVAIIIAAFKSDLVHVPPLSRGCLGCQLQVIPVTNETLWDKTLQHPYLYGISPSSPPAHGTASAAEESRR